MTAVNGAPSGTLILRAARRGAGVGGERGGGRGSSWWEQRGSGSGAARRGAATAHTRKGNLGSEVSVILNWTFAAPAAGFFAGAASLMVPEGSLATS